MPILFKENYDIIPGKEDEYSKFIAKTYLPKTTNMGLVSVGGFYTEIGFGPRVHGVMSVKDCDELSRIITAKQYKDLHLTLKTFIYNYQNSVLEPTGRVKRAEYSIQKGVWKFNQYYDLRPGIKEEYSNFIIKEYLPVMEKIDYVEVTGGWNVILGGISEIVAELTFKDPIDIGRLMNNEDFRRISLNLRNIYAMKYASRVLRCTERFDEPKWFIL
ncbi:MAG: hypothetical protein JXN64_09455 [Spirochaetes bacterium]|nr:hypothetical protein [Spirochaetota bacterium]